MSITFVFWGYMCECSRVRVCKCMCVYVGDAETPATLVRKMGTFPPLLVHIRAQHDTVCMSARMCTNDLPKRTWHILDAAHLHDSLHEWHLYTCMCARRRASTRYTVMQAWRRGAVIAAYCRMKAGVHGVLSRRRGGMLQFWREYAVGGKAR